MIKHDETLFISIGGSVLYPDEGMNQKFLAQFNQLIRKQIAETKRRFFIMVGGGHIGREYQYAGRLVIGTIAPNDLDWLGIHGTRMNGHLLRTIFKDIAYDHVLSEYDEPFKTNGKRIMICAGWKPGWSTDYDMVYLSNKLKIHQGLCLINVPKIYEKDPALFPKSKAFDHLNWKEYRKMIGDWWDPLRQLPFDPHAAKLADTTDFKVTFLLGTDIANAQNALDGKPFKGTTISNTEV